MDAAPLLRKILRALQNRRFEVVMIGNAAAALQGAPVTTLDFDFMFRKSPASIAKLKLVAKDLDAVLFRPFYPVSGLYRLTNDELGIQVDFMSSIHGVRSFAGLRSRAETIKIGQYSVMLASLRDIIASKKAAARERDKAVLPILEKVLNEKTRK